MSFVEIHPWFVPFPIALLSVSVLFEIFGVVLKREDFRKAAFFTLFLGTLGAALAVLTGIQAEEVVEEMGIPKEAIENHETFAFITLGIFGVLFLARAFLSRFVEKIVVLYIIVSLIGVGVLMKTGFLGGHLVFEHGAGVKKLMPGHEEHKHEHEHEH